MMPPESGYSKYRDLVMDFTLDFAQMILKVLMGSAFDIHTYIGIVVGALLSKAWLSLYDLVKAVVILKLPMAKIVFKPFESAVRKLLNKAEPVIGIIEDEAEKKKAEVDSK